MFIDSHAHLNAQEFNHNWENTVTEAKNAGLSTIINIGSDLQDSEWGIQQANQEPIVYTTIGIHPEHLGGHRPDMDSAINNLRRLIKSYQKIVGIGELGLDYTLDMELAPKQAQIELITPQISLALDYQLPIIMHVRDHQGSTACFDDAINLFQQFTTSDKSLPTTTQPAGGPQSATQLPSFNTSKFQSSFEHNNLSRGEAAHRRHHATARSPRARTTQGDSTAAIAQLTGVFHCWTGTPAQAEQALDLGFYISFSGIVTYKSAGHILDAARIVPDDRLLIETDSPFLTPEPARSKEHPAVNEPKYVILTAEKLAEIRQTSTERIARITSQNARRLFKLNQATSLNPNIKD